MYDSILVPLDGSAQAEWALPTAIRLAHATGARLDLINIDVPLPVLSAGLADGAPLPYPSPSLQGYMNDVAGRVARTTDVKVAHQLFEPTLNWFPSIGHEVAKRAEQTNPDLIVMTTHARAAVPRMFLGSVALEVVRWSATPVLLIKPAAQKTPELANGAVFRHVLVALDGSSASEEVLTAAVGIGSLNRATFTLLRAVEPQHIVGVPVEPVLLPIDAGAVREAQTSARMYLDRIADRLRKRDVQVTTRVPVAPNPADAIMDCAVSEGIDIIAMTTHAHGAITRALLGSVANQVLRRTAVPVLIYRPRGE